VSQHDYQLTNKASQIYETQKVKAIFRPLAEATLKEVPISENDRILDIACGTGIILRCIAEQYAMSRPLIGVDLNDGMINMAKGLTKHKQHIFEWYRSDVAKLPFDDHSFTTAFCQQGLQFFSEKVKALTEIKRVLKPDGRLYVTVWSSVSPFFKALADALGEHINNKIAEQSLAPFAFRDEEVIKDLITKAGFTRITSKVITINRQIAAANISIPKEIAGNPVGVKVVENEQDVVDRIVKQVEIAIQGYKNNSGFAIPQETYLFEAQV
jgi:ubiquinone/menaquinone biosynthesis C-methylase UbiE